jgi:hypothetical protein
MPEVHRDAVPEHIAKGDQKKNARGNRQWELPALCALLETILPQKAVFNV